MKRGRGGCKEEEVGVRKEEKGGGRSGIELNHN